MNGPNLVVVAATNDMAHAVTLDKLAALLAIGRKTFQFWGFAHWRDHSVDHNVQLCAFVPKSKSVKGALRYWKFLRWLAKVFFGAARNREDAVYICYLLPAALPVAVASVFRPIRFVYANMDNFALSYKWGRATSKLFAHIECNVARRASIHLLPDRNRWNREDSNVRIIPNLPTRSGHMSALEIIDKRQYRRDAIFTVYVNGWLQKSRGLDTLIAALKNVSVPLRIILAGRIECTEAEELAAAEYCEYLGALSEAQALANYERAHVVLTYYDPGIAINRLAASSKWADCLLFRIPFVVNSEVETATIFRENGACFSLPYHDSGALARLFERLSSDPSQWETIRQNMSRLPISYWDTQIFQLLREMRVGVTEEFGCAVTTGAACGVSEPVNCRQSTRIYNGEPR